MRSVLRKLLYYKVQGGLMKSLLLIFTISVTTLLASCVSTIQTYEGPELPSEEVAILKADMSNIFHTAIVYAVDGIESGFNQANAVVLPGEHIITIRIDKILGIVSYWAYRKVALNAEAGHTYIVSGKIIEEDSIFAWIEEKETGLIVAGKKPD